MPEPIAAAIAANRFGLGARPGELALIGADARGWLRAQLRGPPEVLAAAELRSSAQILAQALALRREVQLQRKVATSSGAADEPAAQRLPQLLRPIYSAEVSARLRQAVSTARPFIERLTQFWTNHFAISIEKHFLAGLAGSFEREAIRPHVLGSFHDMLLAAETHPAMQLYLDNYLSVGPHSSVAERRMRREILELHTLGVGGGYTQQDVTTFAQVLTGWSIGGEGARFGGGEPGRFVFRPELHEPGAKVVLGRRYADEGFEQGAAVLRDLAHERTTARFIATKLARHFIADEPPPQAVVRLADVFARSGGDLPSIYGALIDERAAWLEPLAKYKTPADYVVSSFRGLEVPIETDRVSLAPFEVLGQRTWQPGSPAGWPDRSADWDGAAALMKRIQWADAVGARLGSHRDALQLASQWLGGNLSAATRQAVAHASSAAQALTLLLAAPEFMRR